MRVAVINLTNGGLSGGYKKYLAQVIPRLAAHAGVREIEVMLPAAARDVALSGISMHTWESGSYRSIRRQIDLRLSYFRPDVLFVPTARWISHGAVPVVTMVRNMEPLSVPWHANPILEKVRNSVRYAAAFNASYRAQRVIAVSQYVAEFLVAHWRISRSRIDTIYHGSDQDASTRPALRPSELAGDSRPFIFTAGSIRPARGLEDLIGAWPQIRSRFPGLTLVIGGDHDKGVRAYAKKLIAEAEAASSNNDIRLVGQLSGAEMTWCFQNCELFVMSSRAEACPNTVLEALSHGTLSVSTTSPPMPEMFGDAAIYYQAESPISLETAVGNALISSKPEKARLRRISRVRNADFTWSKTAAQTVHALQRAYVSK